MYVWKVSLQSSQTPKYLQLSTYSKSEPSRVVMLDVRAGAASDRLKSMHLVLLAFKSSWRSQKESCMALKLVWRLVNTVSKEGSEVYRMVLSAQRWIRESLAARATSLMYTEKRVGPRIEPWHPHRPEGQTTGNPIHTMLQGHNFQWGLGGHVPTTF